MIERFEEFDRTARVVRVFTRVKRGPMATDYDDHLLRRKKPQPNPKPR